MRSAGADRSANGLAVHTCANRGCVLASNQPLDPPHPAPSAQDTATSVAAAPRADLAWLLFRLCSSVVDVVLVFAVVVVVVVAARCAMKCCGVQRSYLR